jgi:hypothetical protein
MNSPKWEKLTEVYGNVDADSLKAYLEAEGIPVEIIQESVGRNIYPVTFGDLARVEFYVPQENLEEARKWLAAFEEEAPEDLNFPQNDIEPDEET